MARMDSASSTSPQPTGLSPRQKGPPMAQQPMPSALTSILLRPRVRVFMMNSFGED